MKTKASTGPRSENTQQIDISKYLSSLANESIILTIIGISNEIMQKLKDTNAYLNNVQGRIQEGA